MPALFGAAAIRKQQRQPQLVAMVTLQGEKGSGTYEKKPGLSGLWSPSELGPSRLGVDGKTLSHGGVGCEAQRQC